MKNSPQNQNKICRLCLMKCEHFKVIHEDTKNNLDKLLLKVNLYVSDKPVICSNCAEIVKKCIDFKSKCLDVYNYIVSFINDESNIKVDLRKVYMNQKQVVSVPENCNICGFCMSLAKCSALCLDIDDKNNMMQKMMLAKCLPELDLRIIEKPIICKSCHAYLENYYRFITDCLIVEENIKKYRDSLNIINDKCIIDLANVLQFTLTDILTSKEDDITVDIIKQEKLCVGRENIDSKNESFMEMEDDQKFGNVLFTSENVFTCEVKDKKAEMIRTEGKFYVEQASEAAQENENFVEIDQKYLHNKDIDIKTDQQDFNRFQDGVMEPVSNHISTHKIVSYLVQPTDPLETPIYQCNYCSFQTKDKRSLETHNLIHDMSDITMYQCESCSFKTKYKECISKHMRLTHKYFSKIIPMYQCGICLFRTKYKCSLKTHLLMHKDPSDVMMYQCVSCSYQTRQKEALRKHNLVHKDSSEIRMYQCDSCSYQTKRKRDLESHNLLHKDSSEITMYRCDSCSYETRFKRYLKGHIVIHRVSSEEPKIFHCASCSFETKYKRCLIRHMITHKDPSQITMYQCEACSFQTKRKSSISSHMLTHRNRPEVTVCHSESS